MIARSGEPVEILLVDDHPGDVRLTEEAFAECRVRTNLSVAVDGEEAMAFLRREGEFAEAPRPALIILDLNLPKKNGMRVLTEIRADPTLSEIPVIVLTTSTSEKDIAEAYQRHANCYITKPVDLDKFFEVVRLIESFWLMIVELPRR
ncbi:MAG: response regulator [Actinomycetota bacterium]